MIGLALALITLALYLPSLRHDFLFYDDQQYVTENARVLAGLSVSNVVWAFGYHAGNWHPLAWLSHMLDAQFYGSKPAGHHLTNVLLHVANTVLLFLVLKRLTGAAWRSAAVAALFGWHPLHVESVAWVAERKDLLCAFFWILTLGAYGKYAEAANFDKSRASAQRPRARVWYGATLFAFVLALMSKPMAVTLPFVLLLLDFWPLRRLQLQPLNAGLKKVPRLLAEKIPFLILSAIACGLTMAAQEPAIVSTAGLPILQRAAHMLLAYQHYLGAMLVPRNLAVFYPYETVISTTEVLLAGLLLVAVTLVAVRGMRRCPYLILGWLWFLGTLVPVIGLVQVGDQAWADRYTYLTLIGPFVALVWGAAELWGNHRRALLVIATVVGMAMLVGTTRQLQHWKNTWTLFEHTAKVTRNNQMAVTLLGSELAREGRYEEAIEYYRTALRYKPRYPEAHFYLGIALDKLGKLDEAIDEYKQALAFKPAQEETHILLGLALTKQQRYDEAAACYLAALKRNPESARTHNNLARLYHTQGQLDAAIEHYFAALEADPHLAQAHNNLGILLLQKGRLAEGSAQLREALRLNPENLESQYNLALALNQQAQWSEAAALFAKTVGRTATDPNAHYQFALALGHLAKTREAMGHYASALLQQPDFADALNGLAWILATDANARLRNGTEAVRMAERACELTGRKDPEKLRTLAAAYAESGRYTEAIATVRSAQDLAGSLGRQELAQQCRMMLESFSSIQPWRVKSGL